VVSPTHVESGSRRLDLLGRSGPPVPSSSLLLLSGGRSGGRRPRDSVTSPTIRPLPLPPRHLFWLCWSSNQTADLLLLRTRPWWTDKERGGSEDGFSSKVLWVRRSRHLLRPPPRVRGRFFGFDGEPFSPMRFRYGLAASSSLPPLLLSRATTVMVATGKGVCKVAVLQR
jgi:hypothetical protein